jgi:hypothetical protein
MKISLPAFLGYRDRAKAAPAPSDCLPTSADGPITSSRISACPTTSAPASSSRPPCDSRRLWRLWRLSVRYSCSSPIFPRLADGAPCLAVATTRDTLSLLADMGLGGRFFDMSRNTCAGSGFISASCVASSTRPVPSVSRQRFRERPGIRLACTSLGPRAGTAGECVA